MNEEKKDEKTEEDKKLEMLERQEKANAESKEILDRQEALKEEEAKGGDTEAGMQPPKKEKLSDEDYAQAVMEGKENPLGV